MIDAQKSPRRDAQGRVSAQRIADGVIAGYIHQLSARHAEEADRSSEAELSEPAVRPCR
jgi:hypothetical protein